MKYVIKNLVAEEYYTGKMLTGEHVYHFEFSPDITKAKQFISKQNANTWIIANIDNGSNADAVVVESIKRRIEI